MEIRVNTKVNAISKRGVELSDGTTIESNAVVWTAGTSPNPLLKELPRKKERGRYCGESVYGWVIARQSEILPQVNPACHRTSPQERQVYFISTQATFSVRPPGLVIKRKVT